MQTVVSHQETNCGNSIWVKNTTHDQDDVLY
jgi:hypothetical protein